MTPRPTPRKRRPFLKQGWWKIYLVLLAASAAVQFWTDASPLRDDPVHKDNPPVQTARYDKQGKVSGAALVQTYRRFRADQPDRPTLVLLHGSPGAAANFDRLAPLLSERFDVLAIDLPGFGGSSKWLPSYSTRAHARYVLDVLDQAGIDAAHVLGFSMGSGVALELHDLAPERIASLVFYGGIGIQELSLIHI